MQPICDLLDRALNDEIDFEQFSNELLRLGVESMTFDFVKRHHAFYASGNAVVDHPLKDDRPFNIASVFSKEKIVEALAAFDSRQITVKQFHVALASAGVSFAHVYLRATRAIYLSPQGEFYLEQW